MRQCLVLLTTGFPFTAAEPYLDAELPILAANYTHIFLFAIGLCPGLAPAKTLPENVIVCNCAAVSAHKGKIQDVLHGMSDVVSLPVLPESDRREAGVSPARRLFLGYYLARVRRHTQEIASCLEDVDFSAYDRVCVYSYWFFAAAGVGAALREKLRERGVQNVRFVSRAHSYDLYAYANALSYLPCRTALLQAADGVYTCSENGRQYLTKKYPSFRDKIHTAYLGTSGGTRTDGSTDGVFRILTCCRTIPLKRLDRLADALRLLPPDSRVEWTHIGDGSALPALRRQCGGGFAGGKVRFLGALPHEKALAYYLENPVDLFINLSSREGLPVAVMEALSFGVPALVTDVGGCREIISNEQNGYLLPADFTTGALYNAMRHAMRHAPSLRGNAFRTWQTRFCAEQNYRQFIRAISGEE